MAPSLFFHTEGDIRQVYSSMRSHLLNFQRNPEKRYLHDILTLSETWLKSNYSDIMLNTPGYLLMRKDRQSRGGGVAIYIKDNIATDNDMLTIRNNSSNNLDIIWSLCHFDKQRKSSDS